MKKKILYLCGLFLVMLFTVSNVYALEVAKAGDVVSEEGIYESLRVLAGNQVTSSATIDGISMAAGNDVTITSNVTYGFYAGNVVTVNGNIEKDLFVAGNKIDIGSDTVIGRDAYVAGNQIYVKANIPRDLRAGGNVIDLSNVTIGGDAYIDADKIIFNENTMIAGKLIYFANANVVDMDKAKIGEAIGRTYNKKLVIEYSFKERVYSFLVSAIAAFITMLGVMYILPKTKEKLEKVDLKFGNIVKTICIGFAVLLIIPMIALIAMFTGILTPLSIITLALYGIAIYIANLLVYYIVGHIINLKLFKKEDKYLSLAYGIIVVKLLKYIPILGGYINAFVLFYGLGLIYYYIKKREK